MNGLDRRFRFVEFPCQYVDNPDPKNPRQKQRDFNLIPKLLKELPGIFNWAYDGYEILKAVNYFTDTIEQAELIAQFKQTSNPVTVFCEDYEHVFRGAVSRAEIYGWYKDWCETTGHKAMSRERFLPKFRECMEKQIVGERRMRVNGKIVRVFDFNLSHDLSQQLGTEE